MTSPETRYRECTFRLCIPDWDVWPALPAGITPEKAGTALTRRLFTEEYMRLPLFRAVLCTAAIGTLEDGIAALPSIWNLTLPLLPTVGTIEGNQQGRDVFLAALGTRWIYEYLLFLGVIEIRCQVPRFTGEVEAGVLSVAASFSVSYEQRSQAVGSSMSWLVENAPFLLPQRTEIRKTLPRYWQELAAGCQDLTQREQTVVDLMVRGLDNGAIASALAISESTVKKHVHHIYRKTGFTSRYQLIACSHNHHNIPTEFQK